MDSSLTKKEKRNVYRSLTILVKAMENRFVTVDLRNESSASGKLVFVDGSMNLVLSDVAFIENEESYIYFSSLFVPCRIIRDVILSDDVRIAQAISSLLPEKPKPKEKVTKKLPMTLKRKRMLKNQQESLKLLQEKLKPSTSNT